MSLTCVLMVSCNEPPKENEAGVPLQSLDDSVANYNKQIVKTEIQEIDDYICRYHWEMKTTQTGLRYLIYKTGNGPFARPGDMVTIKYKINLLDGDLVYRSDSNTMFTFAIGKRKVVNGLEEGIMLMNKGGRAKLIVPSHLAFGLLGDLQKIPTRAVLVYDIELCFIDQPKK